MEDSFIANKGLELYTRSGENNNFATLIAILVTLIVILVTIYCFIVTKCSKDDSSLKIEHLTDTRSTQVYPSDLDQWNYCHPKNRSTQTDKLQQRDHGVQTVSYSQSSSASQTACFLDINSRLRPFSDNKTNNNSYSSSAPTTYKLDGPWIHGPFSCDCPGDGCIFRS